MKYDIGGDVGDVVRENAVAIGELCRVILDANERISGDVLEPLYGSEWRPDTEADPIAGEGSVRGAAWRLHAAINSGYWPNMVSAARDLGRVISASRLS